MSNEIVKYENRLNEIPLRRFNSREMNLFLALCHVLETKGLMKLYFPSMI